jgi:Domain of unknown function (DUF4153)
MSNPLTRTLRAYAADARSAFRAAPVEVALGVMLAVALSVEVRSASFAEFDLWRMAAGAALAFPLVFALSVLAARGVIRPRARWMGTAAVLGGCAALAAFGIRSGRDADGWRWALLAAASVVLLVMTPALPWRERDARRSWVFAWRLVLRTAGVALYSLVLFGVLAGAVRAVVSLFELDRPVHLYTDLAGAVFFAFAPWILAGGIHRLSAPETAGGVPEAASRLGRWLYAPVLAIYLAILYAYAAKVLATGELPKNLVSFLVIAAGAMGLLGGILLHPVHADDEHRGVSMLVRTVPALLLPLVPLAAWTLGVRLQQYGWTEFRYVRAVALAVIGVLALLGTIRLVRRRPPLFSTIPAVLAAALLIAAAGPWSASAVSRRDQVARLRAELRRAEVDPRRLPADTALVDSAAYERIGSGARYLLETHGIGALRAVFPAVPDTLRPVGGMARRLGLRSACRLPEWMSMELDWGAGVPLGPGTAAQVEVDSARASEAVAGTRLRLSLDGNRLRVRAEGWTAEADLGALVDRVRNADVPCGGDFGVEMDGDRRPRLSAADAMLVLRDSAGGERGRLLVTSYNVRSLRARNAAAPPTFYVRDLRGLVILPR